MVFLRGQGRTEVMCNGYAPYYVFPGVDEDYREAIGFLQGEAAEGNASGQHVVHEDAERVDVGSLIDQFAADLLGSHRRRRAEAGAGCG